MPPGWMTEHLPGECNRRGEGATIRVNNHPVILKKPYRGLIPGGRKTIELWEGNS